MMSMVASICAVFFPQDVLGEIWDLIEFLVGFLPTLSFAPESKGCYFS